MKKNRGTFNRQKNDGNYIVYEAFDYLGFWYSSDIHNGTDEKVYLKEMPSFEDVYSSFMKYRFCGLKLNKKQDICLSLLYNPYFTEFYEIIKKDVNVIPENRLSFIKRFLLKFLAD